MRCSEIDQDAYPLLMAWPGGVGAILLGIVILSTAHGLLAQAERVQAEQVAPAG